MRIRIEMAYEDGIAPCAFLPLHLAAHTTSGGLESSGGRGERSARAEIGCM